MDDIARFVPRALVAGFAALAAWLLWVSLPWPMVHDAPILHYIAWRISEGAAPYRDLFDMNQPGVYLIHLAALRLLGDGDGAWRIVDLAWLGAAAGAIGVFAARWGTVAGWAGALVFAVYHLGEGAWQAGQRDFLMTPFLVAGALATARWLEAGEPAGSARDAATRSPVLLPGVAGLALGAAATIKPHAVLLALGLGAALAGFGCRPRRQRAVAGVALAAGLAIVPAMVLAWLASRGALGAWWEIVTEYLIPYYSRLTRPEDGGLYARAHWVPLGSAVVLSLASAAAARRFTIRHAIAGIGVAYGVAHFFSQQKGWEYHLAPLAAFAALLAFAELPARVRQRSLPLGVPLALCLVLLLVMLGTRGAAAANANWVWDKERLVRLLISDLEPRLRAGDTVQVLDTTEGGIHALLRLKRAQPTRFVYEFHFHHDPDAPYIRALRAEFARALATRPPSHVVVFERAWPVGGFPRLNNLPDVKRQLDTDYVFLVRRPWYDVYEKRHRP